MFGVRRFERAAPHTLSQPCSTCCAVVVAGANAMGLLSFLKGTAHIKPDEDFDRNVEEEIARHLWVRALHRTEAERKRVATYTPSG